MKKLIFILLFLPLISFSQYTTSGDYAFDNYCFKGDGVGNYIDFGSDIINSNTWTIAFTVDDLSNIGFITCKSISSGNSIYYNAGLLYYTGGNVVIGSGYDLSDGNKHSVIMRYGGSVSIYIYVDGVAQGASISGGILTVGILFQRYDDAFYYEGNAWDFRLWDTDIGETECLKYHTNTMTSEPNVAWLNCNETSTDFATFYNSVSGGTHGTGYGTNFRDTCSSNTSNELNGCTKVVYGGQEILVPYLLDGTSQYSAVSPVLDAAEKYREYPASFWAKKIMTNASKILK